MQSTQPSHIIFLEEPIRIAQSIKAVLVEDGYRVEITSRDVPASREAEAFDALSTIRRIRDTLPPPCRVVLVPMAGPV